MRKLFRSVISFLLAILMIAGNTSFAGVVEATDGLDLNSGLLAYYDFEDVSGTSVPNTVNSAAYTGALSGSAAVVDVSDIAEPGKALQLGSAAGGMQLTNIVNASTSSFAVSLWYKASATSLSNVNLVQAGTIGSQTGRTILILAPSAKYYTYLTGDNAKVTTSTAVTPTAWQHITFVYDQANRKAYFYVNGVADRTDGISLEGTPLSTGDMIIGRHRNDGEGQFNGLIDEVRVYNKVLSAAEAAAIYENTKDAYAAPPVGNITLTVDANETVRVIDSDAIFGINHRYAFNGYGSFDSTRMEIKEDFLALYEDAGFGSIRYPGGTISNLFNWKTTIGPVEQRKNQIHGFYNNSGQGGIAPNFGLTEIGTFAESVGSEIVYVYSLGRGNAQDAADLIEYLNAKVGTNPNGGIDWAAVRAANGHPDPYNVRYFEIGNEMQQAWGGSDGTASQGYWTTSVAAGSEAAYIDGGTATFTKQYAVCEEDWNQVASRTDGNANLVRYMRYANVNPRKYDENGNIVDDPSFKAVNDGVSVFVGSTEWTVVDSFANSGASDQHVVIDYSTGAIKFGDGVHGAIPASGQQVYVSYSVNREGFIAVSQAMRDTIAAINEKEGTQLELYVYSSYESQGFITKMAARNANDLYDGLTIHPYSGTPSGSGAAFYDSAMSLAESVGIQNVRNYVNMMPADKVPVISEYGIFRSTDPLVRSQTHAIYIAKVLMEYVRLGSPYIQKHCLIDWYSSGADSLGPTQQAVIQAVKGSDANTVTGEGTFTFFSTPSAHVFKMLNSAFADNVIATEFSAVPTMSNGAKTLSALASKDSSGTIYLAIVNASREENYELTLNLENIDLSGAAVSAQVLTADSFDAQNSPDNPNNVMVVTRNVTVDPDNFTYTVPKHSFVILTIGAVGEVQEETFMVTVGESLTVIDATGNHVDAVDRNKLNESIATVAVTATTTPATKILSQAVTSLVSGKQYLIVNTRAQKPVTNGPAEAAAEAGAGSGLSLSGSTESFTDSAIWTITSVGGTYTIQDASGKYLTIGSNSADLSDTAANLSLAYGGSTWTIAQNGAYLNHFGGNASTCAAGWQNASAAADPGSQWAIYEVITVPGRPATEIAFTGVSVGETSVRVGGVTYHITVTNEAVSAVTLDYNYSGAGNDVMTVLTGSAIGELPVPMRPGYTFFGWYLNGTQVDSSYVVNDDVTLVADWITVSTKEKPENGNTTGQPFPVNDANGNAYCYRIPGIVTLDNGTVIAMADHRWNTWSDCGGLDTIVSVSADNGQNWTYTFANYLGDNGDTYNQWSTTFIDPAIATDGITAYMIADLFPAGVSTMANGYASQAGNSGFDAEGRLLLRDLIGDTYKVSTAQDQYIPMATSRSYDYYLNPEADGSYTIRKAADDSVVEGYTVDAFYNIRSADGSVDTHLFKADSPYQVYPTNYLYMNTSVDGLTWSAPKLLNLKTSSESAFLVGPGSGTYDPNTGCMIFTAYSFSGSAGSQRSCLIWMDEEGNWTRSEPATDSQWSSEAAAVVLNNGTVRVFFRDANTLLSYTDYKWENGDYVRDENNVRVTTAAAKNGGQGCMLSALKYSQPINGKEAVMVATPATSNSRSDGRIYVFLINEDGTMDLAYEHDITDGTEYYAYSCLTELKKGSETGSLALFWEDSWNSSPAAATIRYSVIPVEQVTARDNDVLHSYVEVSLAVGGTASYTDKTGDYSDADTDDLTENVAAVQITANTQQVDAVAVQSSGKKIPLSDCLYTFDRQNDGTWLISAQVGSRTVYIDPYVAGNGGYPNREYQTNVTLLDSAESGDKAVNFEDHDSGSTTGVGYLHFWDNNDSKLYWDNCSSNSCTGHDLLIYRAAGEGENAGTEIPGYVCINGIADLVDGGEYLIVAKTQSGLYCIMTPAYGGEKLDHVSQVSGQIAYTTTEITITGVAAGQTSVTVGNTVYNITVAPCTSHNYVNGFCTACDAFEPAVLNNGVYEIGNGGQLYWFANLVNDGSADADAILTDDIVINSNVLVDGELNTNADTVAGFRVWNPIGYQETTGNYMRYNGVFDGDGHSVSGLYYNGTGNYMGLFGCTDTGAVIQDVGLSGSWICAGESNGYASVGGIIGKAEGTTVFACWNDSVIAGNGSAVGGIVGEAVQCEIEDCYNTGAVSGEGMVGGIAGTSCGTVNNCYNTGAVTGIENGSDIGGVVGNANHYSDDSSSDDYHTYITNCYNTGSIANGDNIGGILGSGNFCVLNDCYNTGNVTGNSALSFAAGAGGVIGDSNRSCSVTDCYNTGTVTANYKSVGGIIGSNVQGTITNSFYLVGCATDGNGTVQSGVGSATLGGTAADSGTTAKTADQFASGEVTWLLNGSTDQGDLVWLQTIGTDASPKFEGEVVHYDALQNPPYYNGEGQPHTHVYDRQVAEDRYLATPATCEAAATYYKSCSCGETGTETFEHGEALNHAAGDTDNDHLCDACGDELSQCADDDKDHNCDVCGDELSQCGDTDNDHNCDVCGDELSQCGDDDNDHNCDVCGDELSQCGDDDNDHNCDVCGDELSQCGDDNKDHNCDVCGDELSQCADANKDRNCDVCGDELSQCADPNKDHNCDVCGDKLSDCGDKNKDGKCDICGVSLLDPAPEKPYKIANVVSGVHVYWKATQGAVKYGLWRSETGKNGTYKWVANPTVPHFTDTKVETGKTYYYKVTTMNANGQHSEKSEAIGIVYVGTPDITSRFNKAAGITLGWNRIEGATGYAIYRKTYHGTDAWVRIATIEGNQTFTWQDTSVKNNNGSAYKYTIRALAGADMKTLSGCRNAGRSMVRLTSRTLSSAVKASATSIKCTWTTSAVVTGYEVRFMVGSTVYKTFTIGNYKTGVKTFTGLESGKTYKIQVRSYVKIDGMGFYSAWSTARNVTLP